MKHSPVTVEGLTANADGLYRLADLDEHMASSPATIYNLQGQRLDTLQRGVNIVGGKKVVIK